MTPAGFSPQRLARLRAVMAGYVERREVPGLVTLLSRRGETHVEALGQQALGGVPMRRDTIFRIASLTKPVAAAAAMILVEECKLRLDDPVDRLLPELADRRVLRQLDGPLHFTDAARRPITTRDLLTLRMGLGYLFEGRPDWPINQALRELKILQGPPQPQALPSASEWLNGVASLPLMHHPGERWMYDLGLDVLGVLIARAAGHDLESFLRERLFGPLGMRDTGFSVPKEKLERLAVSYQPHPETGVLEIYDKAVGGQWSMPPPFPAAASGLVSTADDYLVFCQMLLQGGRHGHERILARSSVELMTTDQLTPEQRAGGRVILGENTGWGFGLGVSVRRATLANNVGSFGWTGGLGTLAHIDPKEELVALLLTQRMMTSPQLPDVFLDFETAAYAALAE